MNRFGIVSLAAAAALMLGVGSAQAQAPNVQRTGHGDSQVGRFVNTTGTFTICVSATGQSSSGSFGPMASVFVEMVDGSGPQPYSFDFEDVDMAGNPGCQQDTLETGSYTLKVIATSWTGWSVSVYAGQ